MMSDLLVKYGLIYILLALCACKKIELPEPIEAEPVFFSQLKLGNQTLNLAAGQDDYELITRFERDSNVMTFGGVFKRKDCPSLRCATSLRFILRDFQIYNASNFNVDRSLASGQAFAYNWVRHKDSLMVALRPDSIFQRGYKLQWKYRDQPNDQINSDLFQLRVDGSTPFRIGLEAQRGNLRSTQIQMVDFIDGSCKVILVAGEKGQLFAEAFGQEPLTYRWENRRDTTPMISVGLRPNDVKDYRVTVTDARGYVSEASISSQVLALSNAAHHNRSVGFHLASREHVTNRDQQGFRRATIEFLDKDLKSYSSGRFSQPERSSFEIISVTDFEDNAMGQKTKKIQARLSCILYGQDHADTLPLEGTVTFAVAYPN